MKEKIGSLCLLLTLLATGLSAQSWRGAESVALQIHDSKGRPIAEARVVFTFQGLPGETGPGVVATDGKGRAVLANLAPGPWQAEISHPDYLSYIAMIDVRRGKKPLISASFLEAGGRSLSPVKVKFAKGDPSQASPVLEARQPVEPPAPVTSTAEQAPEAAAEVAEAPAAAPVVPAPVSEPLPITAPPVPQPKPEPEPVIATEPEPETETSTLPPKVEEVAPTLEAPAPPVEEAAPTLEAPTLPVEEAAAVVEAPETEVQLAAPITGGVTADLPDEAPSIEPEPTTVEPPRETPVSPAATPLPEPEPHTAADEEVAPPEPLTPEPVEPQPEPVESVIPTPAAPEIEQAAEVALDAVPEPTPSAEVLDEIVTPPTPTEPSSTPVAPPTPLPTAALPSLAPSAMPPPPDPGSQITSHRDGSCSDCESAEWTVQVSTAVPASAPSTFGGCNREVVESARSAMQALGSSIQLELEGFIGPLANGTPQEALRRVEPDLSAPFSGPLAALVGGKGPCQLVGLILPKAVRFSRLRLGAADQEQVGNCAPGQPCAIGDASWIGSARVEKGTSATVVWGLFENRSTEYGRRAYLTAYFRPPSANWKAQLPGAD